MRTSSRRALLASILVLALVQPAAADHKVLVLQAEGRADAPVRARVNAAVLKLAKTSSHQIAPGDITYADAAAAVGCNPDEAACKDEVLSTLAVDEIVLVTVTPKPGGHEVLVRRITKGGASRDAVTVVPADQVDRLDGLAALFGGTPAVSEPRPSPTPAVSTTAPTPSEPAPPVTASVPPPSSYTPDPGFVESPRHVDETPPDDRRRRLRMLGMAGGGTMLLLGVILWGSASSIQGEIDEAPTATKQDLLALQDLEAKGDTYAGLGNLLAIGGVVLGGVSTYYFIKGERARRASTARLTPIVFGDGGGLALTFGGMP